MYTERLVPPGKKIVPVGTFHTMVSPPLSEMHVTIEGEVELPGVVDVDKETVWSVVGGVPVIGTPPSVPAGGEVVEGALAVGELLEGGVLLDAVLPDDSPLGEPQPIAAMRMAIRMDFRLSMASSFG